MPPNLVFGAYHVHSARSDGSGTPDEIAAAAARAGLRFVILTDHGDATRAPDPPAYRHGVLVHRRRRNQHARRARRRARARSAGAVSAGRRGARCHRRHPSAGRLGDRRAPGFAERRSALARLERRLRRRRVAQRGFRVAGRNAGAADGRRAALDRAARRSRSRRCLRGRAGRCSGGTRRASRARS